MTLAAAASSTAAAAETVTTFDPAKGELPEGIVLDGRGSMYVSLAPLGEILRRSPDGRWSAFASIGPDPTGGLSVLGLSADARGTIYAAAPTGDSRWHGVVAISPAGVPRRLPGSEVIQFPNAIALAPRGDLYVTDSVGGSIWRIPRHGKAELWLQHDSLEGTAVVNPYPLGANGIAYHRGRLYVANTEKKHVVEVSIGKHRRPEQPKIVHAFPGPTDFLDGITVDAAGNLYVLLVVRSELIRIDRCGRTATVVDASDGLNIPASLTFGVRGSARGALYVTNLAAPSLTPTPRPAIIAVKVPRWRPAAETEPVRWGPTDGRARRKGILMTTRKTLAGVALSAAALSAVGAQAAHAAPPEAFTITEAVNLNTQSYTFTATGPLCPSGTFKDEFKTVAGNFEKSGVFIALVRTEYVCADRSGTFFATKHLKFTEEEGIAGPINFHGGTGAYSSLKGHGTNAGMIDFGTGMGNGEISGIIVGPGPVN